MNAKSNRKKICWNCEGNVNLDAVTCPYCQASLYPQEEQNQETSLRDYSPPYNARQPHAKSTIPQPPFPFGMMAKDSPSLPPPQEHEDISLEAPEDDTSKIVLTMALLMSGAVFFLFSWILILFSNDGYLVLRWSNAYWYLYLLIGFIMLYFGFRNLGKVNDEGP